MKNSKLLSLCKVSSNQTLTHQLRWQQNFYFRHETDAEQHQSVWGLKYCIFEFSLSHLHIFFWPIGLIQGQQNSCKSKEEKEQQQERFYWGTKQLYPLCLSKWGYAVSPGHWTKGLKALSNTKMNSSLPTCHKSKQPRITGLICFLSPHKSPSLNFKQGCGASHQLRHLNWLT